MKFSTLSPVDFTDDIIEKICFDGMADDGLNADYILVLGNPKAHLTRVPKAVELYKQGRAAKIIMSGGVEWDYANEFLTEAEIMRRTAIRSGVPDDDIIKEEMSRTTIENFLASALIIDRNGYFTHCNNIILVTSEDHMRRSLLIAKRLWPERIHITPVLSGSIPRDKWRKVAAYREDIYKSIFTLINFLNWNHIDDFDV